MRPPEAPRAVRGGTAVEPAATATRTATRTPAKRTATRPTAARTPPARTPAKRTPAPPSAAIGPVRRGDPPRPERPSSIEARLTEQAQATRRRLLRRLGLAAAAAVGAVALLWVALVSSVFALDPALVEVESAAGAVDPAVVQEVTADYTAVPLPRLDTPGLAARLEGITGVRTATVRRDWPRGLHITIEPRIAVAAVPTDGGVALFDSDGVALGTVASPPEGVPVVSVPLDENTPHTLVGALAVLDALPPDLRAQVVGWSAESADQVQLALADGATVRWGGNSENELKAAVLATLRQVPASLYDVSAPRRPITQ